MNGMVATGNEGWRIGDRVALKKEPFRFGTVAIVEDNGLSVMVAWDDLGADELDFQWSNKLALVMKTREVS